MEESEAKKVLEILGNADDRCSFCVDVLIDKFKEKFPEHKKLAEEFWKNWEN